MTRYDRYGDPIEDKPDRREDLELHDPRCRRGWLGDDDDNRPVPCLTCRPHLRRRDPC